MRISNWSIDFLSTCGERFTVNFSINVGSGIGPATRAPVRFAISTGDNAYNNGSQEDYGDLKAKFKPATPGDPTVVPPISFVQDLPWSLAAIEPASFDHFLFNARGPPHA